MLLRVVGERPLGPVGRGHAYAAVPLSAPYRLGVVQHVLVAYLVDVGSPDVAARIPFRTRLVGECRTHERPVHEVCRAVYGQVVLVLGGVEVEVAVIGAYHRGVGQTAVYDGVLEGGGLVLCRRRECAGGEQQCRCYCLDSHDCIVFRYAGASPPPRVRGGGAHHYFFFVRKSLVRLGEYSSQSDATVHPGANMSL